MTPTEFDKDMIRLFGMKNPRKYLDPLIWLATREVTLDTVKLDEWLQKQHGDYMDGKTSMKDLIRREYGGVVLAWVERAIGE